LLLDLGHAADVVSSGRRAMTRMRSSGYDLVFLDVTMPDMDGFEVVRRMRQSPELHDIPVIMMTTLASRVARLKAIEAGANDFIAKPYDATELRVRTASLLRLKEAVDALKRQHIVLERMVQKRTSSLLRALKDTADAQRQTQEAHLDTVQRLAVAAEFKDRQTAVHILRMRRYSAALAKGLRLSPGEVDLLAHASPLHDVGKIGIPDAILLKPGKLDDDEWRLMREHPIIGARILEGSRSKLLKAGMEIAMTHHERWDGSGYPKGLAGESIPLFGRICAVADVFDALTSRRPYKAAFSNEKACGILREGTGSHFDPRVVQVFFDTWDEIRDIQLESSRSIRRSN
jgi:putative two-component system response regulator